MTSFVHIAWKRLSGEAEDKTHQWPSTRGSSITGNIGAILCSAPANSRWFESIINYSL